MLDDLQKLKDFFSDISNWTQLAFARDALLEEIDIQNDNAVCWCVMGAVAKLNVSTETIAAIHESSWLMFKRATSEVNDQIGYEAIMEVIDFAILEEESKTKN